MTAVTEMEPGLVRIGELSRRVGVSDHVLRAWESRYGLLQPTRTAGGFRLYSAADEARVRRMQRHLGAGLSAAEAARAALRDDDTDPADGAPADAPYITADPSGAAPIVADLAGALRSALDDFDEPGAQLVFDQLLSDLSLPTVLRSVVMPYLAELGDRWSAGTASVAQEHFASTLLRGRLSGLARGWGGGHGPLAVLACPPGELHDLPLMVFGLVLARGGWRIRYLGPSTPIEEIQGIADDNRCDLVVVAATLADHFAKLRPALRKLAATAPLALAGDGASEKLAAAVGARYLPGDPVTEAEGIWWSK